MSAALLLFGLIILVGGGSLLVKGAADLATRSGVSPMIVGLTVVGFGTSMPELVVNVFSASQGATDLAFGNVVGSNISNIALILGAAAFIKPMTIQGQVMRREIPLLLLVTTIMTVMVLDGVLEGRVPTVGRSDSIVLLLLFAIFLYMTLLELMAVQRVDPLVNNIAKFPLGGPGSADSYAWALTIGGLLLLFVGGKMSVDGAVGVAALLGVPASIVGLFVVAIGTSTPELATTIIAAMRGESDLALGNIVGSNLFNSLIVLPVTGLVRPVPVPEGGITDLLFSWGLVALLIPLFYLGSGKVGRTQGVLLLAVYAVFAAIRLGGS